MDISAKQPPGERAGVRQAAAQEAARPHLYRRRGSIVLFGTNILLLSADSHIALSLTQLYSRAG